MSAACITRLFFAYDTGRSADATGQGAVGAVGANTTYATKRATVAEIEEVFANRPVIRTNLRRRAATHLATGTTDAGRPLTVAFIYYAETNGIPDHSMGAVMTKADDIDEVTGLSLAEMEAAADDHYEHRDQAAGDDVPTEYAPEIRSVVSVRFSRGELDGIATAAAAAGLPLSTYIRNAALAASMTIDVEAARRELRTATKALDELRRRLSTAA